VARRPELAVPLHHRLAVERHAERGREPPGEDLDPRRLLETQAARSMRQGHEAAVEGEADVEHFGVASPLRRVVVEEDHPLPERHGPRRPGQHGAVADQLGDAEKPHAVEKHGHVPAGDRHGLALGEDLGDLVAVPLDGRPAVGRRAALELLVDGPDRVDLLVVEPADGVDGRAPGGLDDLGIARAAQQLAGRLEHEIEAVAVELLHGAQAVLARPVGVEQVRIGVEELLGAPMEAQVDHRPPEVLAQLVVLDLALLPARRHRRDLPADAEPVGGADQGRPQALGSEEGDSPHGDAIIPVREDSVNRFSTKRWAGAHPTRSETPEDG